MKMAPKVAKRNSINSLHRQMAWLASPTWEMAPSIMSQGDLIPASQDVMIMERREAEEALRSLRPIHGPLQLASLLASVVITDASLIAHDVDHSDYNDELVTNQLKISNAAQSIVAMLLAQGVLKLGGPGE
jgi:hypothetical protein